MYLNCFIFSFKKKKDQHTYGVQISDPENAEERCNKKTKKKQQIAK